MSIPSYGISSFGAAIRSPHGVRAKGGFYLLSVPTLGSTTIWTLNRSLKVLSSGAGPSVASSFNGCAMGGGKRNLYLADVSGIRVIDPSSLSVTATYSLPFTPTGGVALGIGGNDSVVYLAARYNDPAIQNKLYKLDATSSMSVIASANLPASGFGAIGAPTAVAGDGTHVWVLGLGSTQAFVALYDLTTLAPSTAAVAFGSTTLFPCGIEAKGNKGVMVWGRNQVTSNTHGADFIDNSFSVTSNKAIDAAITAGIRSICGPGI